MYFTDMNPKSRLWIYQADQPFTGHIDKIKTILDAFVDQWQAHRQQLMAAYELAEDYFIMFAVDEEMAAASGCSIDSSVRVIQQIEDECQISLLNRMLLAYKDNDQINITTRSDFASGMKDGRFDADTIVFNNTIQTIEELKNWVVPTTKSWHWQAFAAV